MTNVHISLDDISTGYTVFEKDQVLTESQLNGVTDYLDDQNRLTRVVLIGVGIGCGLRLQLLRDQVVLSHGMGTTTDGDLFYFPEDTTYDRFKPYDRTAPVYPPFYVKEEMISAYQLVAAEEEDDRAEPLSHFTEETDRPLERMAAILLMESCEKDEDLCTGTDCDNRGKDALNTPKLILVDQASAAAFRENLTVGRTVVAGFRPVVADRVVLSAGTNTPATLAAAIRAACTNTHGRLLPSLLKLIAACGPILKDRFPADPSGVWQAQLNAFNAAFNASDLGLQYYYDFLGDLVETHNDFLLLLQEDTTLCCPPLDAFPKHLALGNLSPGVADENRTGFYPSPIVSGSTACRGHARFLAMKLHTLITTFVVPTNPGIALRITPSHWEDHSLEERAIPFYYDPAGATPVQRWWNWDLTRRGMETWNYSYNADLFHAEGGAASPLTSRLGRFGFFRIEGHLGKPVADALHAVENEITAHNLPFAVRAVLLDPDRRWIFPRPPRYTDLNRMHYLMREAVSNNLNDLTSFTDTYSKTMEKAVASNVIIGAPGVDTPAAVRSLAAQKSSLAFQKVGAAQAKLTAFDPGWEQDAGDAVTAAAEMRYDLGNFARTEFMGPVDGLIANPYGPLVNWLGDIIKQRDDAEDEKVMFASFVKEHPALEHLGGVERGGTFILVYDSGGRVVGDLALPYHVPAPAEPPPAEPPLKQPGFKFPWTREIAFRVNPTFDTKLATFATKLDQTSTVLDVFKTYQNPNVFTRNPAATATVADPYLGQKMREMETQANTIDLLRKQTLEPEIDPATRKVLDGQLKDAETGLAATISAIGRHAVETDADVTKGSDSLTALSAASDNLSKLSSTEARKTVKAELTSVANAGTPELKTVVKTMLKRPGF